MMDTKEPRRMQRRGIARRQAILDAAVHILEVEGYEATTLKAMADLAGIPVASMYHYFPDRQQVEIALLSQYLPILYDRIEAAMAAPGLDGLADWIETVIDPMIGFFQENPACAELWFFGRHQALADLVRDFDDKRAVQLWQRLTDRGLLRAGTPLLAVQIAFEAGNHLFDLAFRQSRSAPAETAVILTEARRLIIAYLGSYAP